MVGSAAAVGSRVAGRVLGLGFVVLLARRQSPVVFAEYNYLLILSAALTVITDAGVAAVAGREVARGEAAVGAAYRAAFVVQLVTGLAGPVAVIGLGLVVPGPDRDIGALVPAGVLVAANSIFNLQAELLRGAGRPLSRAVSSSCRRAAAGHRGGGAVRRRRTAGGVCRLGRQTASGGGPLPGVVAGALVGGARRAAQPRGVPPRPVAGRRHHPGDRRVAIRRARDRECRQRRALADFAVSSRYLEVSAMISQTLGIGMLPALARRSSASPDGIRRFMVRILWLDPAGRRADRAGGPGDRTVTVAVFGSRYSSAVLPSQVFVALTPVVVLHFVTWYSLVAERHERWVTAAAAVGAVTALATVAWIAVRPTATVTVIATGISIAAATAVLCIGVARSRRPGRAETASSSPRDAMTRVSKP